MKRGVCFLGTMVKADPLMVQIAEIEEFSLGQDFAAKHALSVILQGLRLGDLIPFSIDQRLN
ncbi:hypothetical protein [Acididesulfobacillus acetoxydans]|uniref:hypothetical protein n=1 Tax=Acididesulfobacillus acetoxydans TaxID=1561005 RepID=UPI0021BF1B47|nr:hypothetical protein [Acididesulfobacillus acetoxydans]